MPSTYAHYRFGVEMLADMPADVRRSVQRFRRLYDVGLHGPDLFFYYNPVVKTRIGGLGSRFHDQSGQEFFTRVCRSLRLSPSEAGTAYLYGVLCHYCLDSICHPFVIEKTTGGPATHVELETEFDRFLLEADGKTPACAQDLSPHIRLTPGECETAAAFYPSVTARHIRDCVRNMAFFTRLLAAPEGAKRDLLNKGMALAGHDVQGMLMPLEPNPRCADLDEPLLALYRKATALYPVLLGQIQAHMTYGAPLGPEFAANFG